MYKDNALMRSWGIFGCLIFTILIWAKFIYLWQHFSEGHLPLSEANFVLEAPASYLYDIFGLEAFAGGEVDFLKISPGEDRINKLIKVSVFAFAGHNFGMGAHSTIFSIAKVGWCFFIKNKQAIMGP